MNNKIKGAHYDCSGVPAIDIIDSLSERANLPRKSLFPLGNAIKYLLRCGAKAGEDWKDDVAKAENYLHRARTGEWMEDAK